MDGAVVPSGQFGQQRIGFGRAAEKAGGEDTVPQVKTEERVFGGGGVFKRQIACFLDAVRNGNEPVVTAGDARKALEAALIINRKLEPRPIMAVA